MRKKLLLLVFCLFIAPFAVDAEQGWLINNFHSDIQLQSDGQVLIQETITVNFSNLQKHGIYRDIPYVYQQNDGSKLHTKINVKSVLRNGHSELYQVTTNNANLRIKIGDPDQTISGRHTYAIIYEATGVILEFTDYDEIYWNVTGHDWDVPIQKASASISLPSGDFKQASCYFGARGSSDPCEVNKTSDSNLRFSAPKTLTAGDNMTVAVGFTKGLVPILKVDVPPTAAGTIFQPSTYITFIIVLVTGMLTVLTRWWKTGRDPKGRQTISPEYDPPANLRPAEIGVLMDERADTLDVSATIVDLAVRGLLTIRELPKKWGPFSNTDYELNRIDKSDTNLLSYEQDLLAALFRGGKNVKLSSLKKKFYKDLATVKKKLYQNITNKKLFAGNPETVRRKHIIIAFLVLIFGAAATGFGFSLLISFLVGAGLALDIIGLTALTTSFFMPRRTIQGRELYRQSLGYKLFVSGTEKYRQPFFERENIFMEVLPYAIVFGVTKKLARAFEEMGLQPQQPNWYISTTPFNAAVFASSINSFSASLSSTMASSPSGSGSSGGGFSGGGFGGGGGGSW